MAITPIATSGMDPRMARPARAVMRPESTAKRRPLIHGTRPGPEYADTGAVSVSRSFHARKEPRTMTCRVLPVGKNPKRASARRAAALPSRK